MRKKLYQNIHPAKLTTDIGVFFPSTSLIWLHQLVVGVLIGFIPAIIASAVVMKFGNLQKYAATPFGGYIAKYMTGTMEALRFVGLFVSWFGAWNHSWWIIGFGIIIVVLAWLRGKIVP